MTSKDHGTESELEKDELWMNVFHQTTSITAMEFFPLIYWPRALMAIILLQQDKWFKWWHWRYTPWEYSAERESDIYLRSVSLLFPLITAQQIENVEDMSPNEKKPKPFFHVDDGACANVFLYLNHKIFLYVSPTLQEGACFVTDIVPPRCNQANARNIMKYSYPSQLATTWMRFRIIR